MARHLEAVLGGIRPDPLFGRRLRGIVLNRHVAQREGLTSPGAAPLPRAMGRLGRACLLASVVLATSVAGAAGAAQESVPGDPMYSFKLQIEAFRLRVAPVWMRDDLASTALAERLEELETLLVAGEWALAQSAAAAVQSSADALAALAPSGRLVGAERIEAHLASLEALIAGAPDTARGGLERALLAVESDPPGNAYGSGADGIRGNGNTGDGLPPGPANGLDTSSAAADDTPDEAAPVDTSTPTPDPKETKKPKATPKRGDEE